MDPNQQPPQPTTQFEASMPASPSLGGPVAPLPQTQEAAPMTPPQPKKNMFPILLIAVLVIGVIGIAGYFMFTQNYTAPVSTPQYQVQAPTATPTEGVASAEDVDIDTSGLDSDLSSLDTDLAGL